jgi:hypothetical protein
VKTGVQRVVAAGETMNAALWQDYVDRYFAAALWSIENPNGSLEKDREAKHALADIGGDRGQRVAQLADWIRFYKVHRVAAAPEGEGRFADMAAEHAIDHLDTANIDDIPSAFNALRAVVATAHHSDPKKRRLISVTSKILWCKFPDAAPIYDQFAADAVWFLVKLLKATEAEARYDPEGEEGKYEDGDGYTIGKWEHGDKCLADRWFYKDYYESHRVLYARCRSAIEARLTEDAKEKGIGAFQIFDKILWISGNPGRDYSLKSTPLRA